MVGLIGKPVGIEIPPLLRKLAKYPLPGGTQLPPGAAESARNYPTRPVGLGWLPYPRPPRIPLALPAFQSTCLGPTESLYVPQAIETGLCRIFYLIFKI